MGFSALTQLTDILGIRYRKRVRPETAWESISEPGRTENILATTLWDQAVTRPSSSSAAEIREELPGRYRSCWMSSSRVQMTFMGFPVALEV